MNGHCNHLALKFSVCVKERQDRLPTMYWLPKLHKTPYTARFIANSSSCTTTELSKLLTSCLTAVKNYVIRYCEKVYERSGKNLFWSIKNSGEVLNKLKSRGFRATSLSTYDFSTLYTTLPHNLIKEKLINLIEWTFKWEGSPYIACNERQAFFTSEDTKRYKLFFCSSVPVVLFDTPGISRCRSQHISVESSSLLHHSIYLWFICFTWWSIDALENLHADRTTVCFEPW